VLLIYKARKYEGNVHGQMTIGAARADHFAGPYKVLSEDPIFPPEFHLEDPFIWKTEGGYEMIAKDMDGNLCGEKYGGVHVQSSDGLQWSLCAEPKAYSRHIQWEDGVTQLLGNMERPCLLFQDGKPTHLFAAVSDGKTGFSDATETWNMVVRLVP
jgi:hypothetical protein